VRLNLFQFTVATELVRSSGDKITRQSRWNVQGEAQRLDGEHPLCVNVPFESHRKVSQIALPKGRRFESAPRNPERHCRNAMAFARFLEVQSTESGAHTSHRPVCIALGWPTIQEIRTRFNQRARLSVRARSPTASQQYLEARGGIEPPMRVLQTLALPLGHRALFIPFWLMLWLTSALRMMA
jgi:hypothetical protein